MGYCTCVPSYQLLMTKPVYIVFASSVYLRQIRFVVQRILFLQKFCSLDNFLCILTFSNQERLFFADILFFLKFKISATNACLKNELEERIKMEEKVKYTFLGGIVVLLTKLIFNLSAEDFLMHRSWEVIMTVNPYWSLFRFQLGSSSHLVMGHVLKLYNNFEILYKSVRSFLMAT